VARYTSPEPDRYLELRPQRIEQVSAPDMSGWDLRRDTGYSQGSFWKFPSARPVNIEESLLHNLQPEHGQTDPRRTRFNCFVYRASHTTEAEINCIDILGRKQAFSTAQLLV
jgi:hypothetical protein